MSTCEACGPPGKEWSGTIQGKDGEIGGVNAYFAGENNKGAAAILLVHDIYGIKKNLQLLADKFAEAGYLVVAPDFFGGEYAPTTRGPEFQEWFGRHPLDSKWGSVDAVLKELRDKYNAPRIGAEGFCWGGHFVVKLAGRTSGQTVDASATPHASFVKPEDVEAIQKPTLFLFSGDTDPMIPPDTRKQYEGILKTKPGSDSKWYPEQNHGWSLRGDDTDEVVARDAHDAYLQALNFFKKHVPAQA